jgi:hypothetical protein
MKRNVKSSRKIWVAGLLGAVVLAGSPFSAQADQGKWWEPKQGGDQRTRTESRGQGDSRDYDHRSYGDRGNHYGWRNGGPRFRRDTVVLRDGSYGRGYRVQRVYVRPLYFQRRHLVVIRPVRYYVGADFTIGGVRIHARTGDYDRYVYGCNFCDARFGSYAAYERHVVRCDDRPRGYRFDVCDWDSQWDDWAWDSHYHGHDYDGDHCDDDWDR